MPESARLSAPPHADDEWNAGDLGCGELVLDLRKRLRAMPGSVIKVISHDPGAIEDLPAWCRLTRNELVHHDPVSKSFWIRSRTDWN
ncbi:sulfurtransferase TusA family protein [Pseudolabrys sp. FHR47]|uniref:sulfurtransferase TusA family protein n=1 Tax=Pseudolabrys sp. FHR47 TaxID=2562284 RepID=UPI001FEF81EF|nr:sulfurtransferase TusA family protein [Pseudolabrys sp. FHR47]